MDAALLSARVTDGGISTASPEISAVDFSTRATEAVAEQSISTVDLSARVTEDAVEQSISARAPEAAVEQSISTVDFSARATEAAVEQSISTVDAAAEISAVDSSACATESAVEESIVDASVSPASDEISDVESSVVGTDGSKEPLISTAPPEISAVHLADIRAKIIKQVEYYFSDENLPSDNFMMNYVKKNKGFVPISVIATFRKVKRLTKDNSTIVDALKESSQLVVSSDAKKVKRLHPLPSSETKDPKFCTIVVENLPEDHSTENIRRVFSQAGSIKSISIHDPQIPGDANRTKAKKQISGKLHALIEYETEKAAEKAVVTLNDETDWRNGLRVKLLQKRPGQGQKARMGTDSEKGVYDRVSASVKEGEKNHSNEKQTDGHDDEEREHVPKEKNGQKNRNRSKGRKQRPNNGMGHGTTSAIEPSKPPPGPRMPDGTKGFTMGRGRPLTSGNV